MPLRVSLNNKANNTVDMVCHKKKHLEQITALELQDRFAKFPTHLVHIGFSVSLNPTIRHIKAQKQLKPYIKTDDLQKKTLFQDQMF
jgi:hypothetical protein